MSDLDYHHSAYPVYFNRDFSRIMDRPHYHNFMQIWYVHNGSCIHYHNDQNMQLCSGAVAIVPAWCRHLEDARHAPNDLFICNLADALYEPASAASSSQPWRFTNLCLHPLRISAEKRTPIFYPRIQTLREIDGLNHELHRASQHWSLELLPLLRGKTAQLMSLIAEEYAVCEGTLYGSPLTDYCPSIHRALHYIHEQYRQEITAEQVARISMLSMRTFFRIFKEMMDMTFVQYILYLRVLRAKELLKNTDRILSDIAIESGFQNTSYFHRTFRQQTGFTPRGYRMFVRNRLCAYPKLPLL